MTSKVGLIIIYCTIVADFTALLLPFLLYDCCHFHCTDVAVFTVFSDSAYIEPKDRIKIILDMAKFILPTLQAVSIDDLREDEAESFNVLTINLKSNGNDTGN